MLKFHIKFILILLCILVINSVFADDFDDILNSIDNIANFQQKIDELYKEQQAILQKINIESQKQVEQIIKVVNNQQEMNNTVQQEIDELKKTIQKINLIFKRLIDKLSGKTN